MIELLSHLNEVLSRWTSSVAGGLAMLALVVSLGLALGSIRIRGIRLGVSGVLFSALLAGQMGLRISGDTLPFVRDFALILFVYAIGLQVGPGFVASLRSEGLRLNVLSICVILLGATIAALCIRLGRFDHAAASGLYAGSFTTTPGLAAGQEALRHKGLGGATDSAINLAGLAYTVTYPFGILGPILTIVVLRKMFGVHPEVELAALAAEEQAKRPPISMLDIEVTESLYAGIMLKHHPLLRDKGIMFSRMLREGEVSVPTSETEVRVGDVFRAVGARAVLEELTAVMGRRSAVDLGSASKDVRRLELVVTRTAVLRRTLRELDLIRRTGVTVTRVNRAGVELAPRANVRLQFGDRVHVVGPEAGLTMVETELGNCQETLNRPQLVPIFLGIFLGVLVGSIPLRVPGLSSTISIGLAGGPMLAAILLSQLGNIGSVVWYMPVAANQLFRDFGLAVFLACVGLQAGDHFVERVVNQHGLVFIAWGAAVTVLPVLIVAILARWRFKTNFVTLSGWVAGAMTSSPALLFANDMVGSDAPAVAYAAVAPLGTLLPILCAQLLVMFL
jgi:putative transport protein